MGKLLEFDEWMVDQTEKTIHAIQRRYDVTISWIELQLLAGCLAMILSSALVDTTTLRIYKFLVVLVPLGVVSVLTGTFSHLFERDNLTRITQGLRNPKRLSKYARKRLMVMSCCIAETIMLFYIQSSLSLRLFIAGGWLFFVYTLVSACDTIPPQYTKKEVPDGAKQSIT